jgi:ElaB/YqjD/DUF883 family membrane-anchored ribosome-binding protein
MSSTGNDSKTHGDFTAAADPFSVGDVDTASEAVKTSIAGDEPPDCRLQPTAEADESPSELLKETDQPSINDLSTLVEGARDGLEAAAESVRTADGRQMLATLEAFIKNNPGVSLTVAAAFGFVVGRSIRRDKPTT